MTFISKTKSIVLAALVSVSMLSHATPEVDYVKNGITVWKVGVPGTDIVGFKAQGVINYSIDRVAAALTDINSANEWLPRIGNIQTLSKNAKVHSADLRMVIDLPFPLKDRELFITSKVTRQANGDLWVSNDLMKNPPKVNPDYVQITQYEGGWKLEQISADKTSVTLTGYADPAGVIPTFIANLFATQQPYEMLVNLEKQTDKARYKTAKLDF